MDSFPPGRAVSGMPSTLHANGHSTRYSYDRWPPLHTRQRLRLHRSYCAQAQKFAAAQAGTKAEAQKAKRSSNKKRKALGPNRARTAKVLPFDPKRKKAANG